MTDPKFGTWEDAVRWLRDQPDKQDLVRAAYYDDPLELAVERYWSCDEWRAIKQYLPRSKGLALDVGAGRGIASYALAREGFEVVALEPDGSELVGAGAIRQMAEIDSLPVTVVEEFSERLPFPDQTFDLVFARAVLHHTENLEKACKEFYRVLKPGGKLIAVREHVISRKEDLPTFLDLHPLHNLYGGEHAYLVNQYTFAIESSGIKVTSILAPFDSPINFAPYSEESLRAAIADRAIGRFSNVGFLIKKLLNVNFIWVVVKWLLSKLDSRPGRLYSFIGERI